MSRPTGFTLLELLIALSVFAVIAALAYGGLGTVLQGEAELARQSEQLAGLQRAFLLMGQDIEQYIPRPIRNEFGDTRAALQGGALALEFTRAGWPNPLGQQRSSLQRVAYALEQGALYRIYWNVLDRAQDSAPQRAALLDGVEAFSLRYLDNTLAWHDQWPPREEGENQGIALTLKAVEVSVRLPEWGTLIRLFPTTDYAEAQFKTAD